MASAELERARRMHPARVRMDSLLTKVALKATEITDREHEVGQAPSEKERATCEASVAEKNWPGAHLHTQRDRELKKGGGHTDGRGGQGT